MVLDVTPGDSAKTKLRCTITITGEDVIGGVQDMVETGIICSPPPDWVGEECRFGIHFGFYLIFLGSEPGHRRDKQAQVEGPDQRQQG